MYCARFSISCSVSGWTEAVIGAVQLGPLLGLERAELSQHVVVRESRQARDVLLARERRGMAGAAVITFGRRASGGDLVGIARSGRRRRRRLGRVVRREISHLIVGEAHREGRHLGVHASLVAEEDELPVDVEGSLAGQGRRARIGGIAVRAVTGRADGRGLAPARLDVSGAGRRWKQTAGQRDRKRSANPRAPESAPQARAQRW